MWSRKDLKKKSRIRFTANYWRCVLVALILGIITGGVSLAGGGGTRWNMDEKSIQNSFDDLQDQITFNGAPSDKANAVAGGIVAAVVGTVMVVLLIVIVVSIALDIFLFNPLEVSTKKFFVDNIEENAELGAMKVGFSPSYKNIVKVEFFRDLFVFLWSLLFLIPGIIKTYEYRMIPYLLADNPDMSREDAFAMSKKMMDGNKWRAFVLDLSFIGWEILSILTCGILSIFYVNPYKFQTDAALYDALVIENAPSNDGYNSYVEVQ